MYFINKYILLETDRLLQQDMRQNCVHKMISDKMKTQLIHSIRLYFTAILKNILCAQISQIKVQFYRHNHQILIIFNHQFK